MKIKYSYVFDILRRKEEIVYYTVTVLCVPHYAYNWGVTPYGCFKKALFDNIITIGELAYKRKKEMEQESRSHSEQLIMCSQMIRWHETHEYKNNNTFNECEVLSHINIDNDDVFEEGVRKSLWKCFLLW